MYSFIIIIQLFFVCSLSKDYHMSFVLLSAPKKIPMLNYTMEYVINAINRKPIDIYIDHFALVKGCNKCDYPEMNYALNELKRINISSSIIELPSFEWFESGKICTFEEMYQSL